MLFNPELCRNESEVESKLIVQYLLPQLGYTPDTWHQEVALGSIRLDFLAFAKQIIPLVLDANSPMSVVMEAKHPKQNLNNHVLRLRHYLTSLNAQYGLLTNGKEIRIYEKLEYDIELVFQCLGKDVEEKIEEIKGLIGRESLKKTELLPISIFQTFQNDLNVEKNRESSMKIIAIYHNKGGVGKTTTVVNLAAAIRKKGKRVLVIDLDSQANTTFATGLVKFDDEKFDDIQDSNVFHILSSEDFFSIAEIARKSNFCDPGIQVVPAHIDLIKKETVLNGLDYSRLILIEKLEEVKDQYDVVLIDTPPSLNLYAKIALITTDYLIIPSDLKPFANQGLTNVKDFVKDINGFRKQVRKPAIQILGVLASKISTNHKFVQTTLKNRMEKIPERYNIPMMDTVIYERDDLAKCAEKVLIVGDMEIPDPISVIDFKPDSTSAQEFILLGQEVLEKIGLS
ncbi:AAA family ATPase [Umezakia ovalisporum]|uniref:AAA family ATPase n=1 Tax=Umezakia ovalisporum FSS-43 TaxID=2740520 RepID=A0ABT6K1Y0_9CYAN|nr:AAA family ATPase [Umezakia ovalisporum]MDH6056257.1 AAA family ATPase [Umezakia ovalisporum FSS-43]MDH6067787.1 AAA family ATPase [Umezakia ovalisporum APH033B]MDH6070905.1 AAA family ATPase [Umezakia ovalisporum CobakiLakeA]MDH6074498.1 AAA family ATPase [Umezakia ovalisporum CS-1034]MDH6080688.1 AAA family ATPase [Umezakia ovalisporum FSS-44]